MQQAMQQTSINQTVIENLFDKFWKKNANNIIWSYTNLV
jgi:hypothetical protein